jgi:RNA polymerase sigma-70 factor (ECF subfamily)
MEDTGRHLDAELVRRWQSGDLRAYEALVRRWQAPMARFLARLAPQAEAVPDLCQDVFLRLYRAGPRYREGGAFATWLYRIALNVARDAGRRRRHAVLPLDGHEPPSSLPGAEEVCEREEVARSVADAVAQLPPPLREVLVLRHYEDMNFERMARVLGTPASTLKSRFAAALARLRERLRHLEWSHEESEP